MSSSQSNYQFTVTTSPSNCTWTAKSNSNWITISFGQSGGNGGTVGYTVAANVLLSSRSGSITVTPNSGVPVDFAILQDPLSYTISGFTTPVTSGVAVALTGSQTASTSTDSNGNYSFSNLTPGGAYTVTASLAGYTISPGSKVISNLSSNQSANFTLTLAKSTISGTVTVSGTTVGGVTINVNGPSGSSTATTDASGKFSISLFDNSAYTLSAAKTGYSFSAPVTIQNLLTDQTVNFTGIAVAGLEFYPVTPCRLVDTRRSDFQSGFGTPSLIAAATRSFPISSQLACAIPVNAKAYSLNVTVVTKGYLGYLSIWPAGQSIPIVSTLNSYSQTSTAVSNAAIVPAGANGAISVYVTDATDLILDINGYFAAPLSTSLQFYPVTPCRLIDTRLQSAPALAANQTRHFTIAGVCNTPTAAKAYSLNFTAIPQSTLGILTVWPTGSSQPNVSTLNVYQPGTVVANAAIVPAGTGGSIDVYATDVTNLAVDINGYFAPAGANGLEFYPVTPCRIADTRVPSATGLGPPTMSAGTQRSFPVPSSPCGIPSTAGAYSLNFTAVPQAPQLGIFEVWPTGQSQPVVSTMNSYNGSVVANAAIVPAGTGGAITVYVTDNAAVLFDVNGYFAASQ